MTSHEKLLCVKELADALGRSRVYVWRMRLSGFKMPGNTATLTEAREWLSKNPPPCRKPAAG